MSVKDVIVSGFSSPKVSSSLLNIIYTLGGTGGALVAYGGGAAVFGDTSLWLTDLVAAGTGLGFLGGAFNWYETQMKEIPNDPASVGLLTIWGERMPIVVPQGKAMRAKFFPFYIDYLDVPVVSTDFDFPFDNILCAATSDTSAEPDGTTETKTTQGAGASVLVKVSITIFPDYSDGRRLIKYLNNRGAVGIGNILENQVSQSVRELARKYEWQKFTALKEQLTVMLLAQIADIDFRELPCGDDGLVREDIRCMFLQGEIPSEYDDGRTLKELYRSFPAISDPIHRLFPELDGGEPITDETILRRTRQEIEVFLKIAREFRFADIMDLGVEVFRLNVTHIDPSTAMREAVDKAERELAERHAEQRDVITDITLAKQLATELNMSEKDALDMIQVIKGRASKQIIASSGSPLTDLGALISGNKK